MTYVTTSPSQLNRCQNRQEASCDGINIPESTVELPQKKQHLVLPIRLCAQPLEFSQSKLELINVGNQVRVGHTIEDVSHHIFDSAIC